MDKRNRRVYIVVAEGRQPFKRGLTLYELAKFMVEKGAYSAINLDGGGSSTLYVEGKRVSGRPTFEPNERKVANNLAFVKENR